MGEMKNYIYIMTKLDFLERANKTHGYKYTYLNLRDKILSSDNIQIEFEGVIYTQKVVKHMLGRCPEKNTQPRTQEEFIKKCREIWNNKYDYSITKYNGANRKVKFIFEGIILEQMANSHLLGKSPDFRMSQDSFLKRAYEKWSNRYDYSLVMYKNCKSKVKIIYNG